MPRARAGDSQGRRRRRALVIAGDAEPCADDGKHRGLTIVTATSRPSFVLMERTPSSGRQVVLHDRCSARTRPAVRTRRRARCARGRHRACACAASRGCRRSACGAHPPSPRPPRAGTRLSTVPKLGSETGQEVELGRREVHLRGIRPHRREAPSIRRPPLTSTMAAGEAAERARSTRRSNTRIRATSSRMKRSCSRPPRCPAPPAESVSSSRAVSMARGPADLPGGGGTSWPSRPGSMTSGPPARGSAAAARGRRDRRAPGRRRNPRPRRAAMASAMVRSSSTTGHGACGSPLERRRAGGRMWRRCCEGSV